MKKCRVISITGPSGVGKTTISKLISCCFENSILLSGDDAHLWERGNINWKNKTHLNPAANDLEKEKKELLNLKSGKTIERVFYNHDTGKFDSPKKVFPAENIIYEGLHTLYDEELRDLSDIKIYIDVPHKLKSEWKIARDTAKRGYTKEQVQKTIKDRMLDEKKFILPQKEFADIIIEMNKTKDATIEMSVHNLTNIEADFVNTIKKMYDLISDFVFHCKKIGCDNELVSHSGGNISVKDKSKILISSSGIPLNQIDFFKNFCILDKNKPSQFFFKDGRPSMEMSSHLILKNATIHTHPEDLLAILCSEEAESIIKEIFSDYNFVFFQYIIPGQAVADLIEKSSLAEVLFFQNHGVFVTTDNLEKSCEITKKINNLAKIFLNNNLHNGAKIKKTGFLFPDAAVLKKNNESSNSRIHEKIINSGLTPRFLTDDEIRALNDLEEEKYRKKMELK
ncbi:MAG: class II aldolase/adducin family protein [Promethearchaeota archaeon]|jgi:uridine kinase